MLVENDFKFLKKLVSLQTIAGKCEYQKKAIALVKKNLPAFFKSISFYNNGFNSTLFYFSSKNRFDVIFIVHVDVVGGRKKMFKVVKKNNRLYGRGVFDMKGPIVAVVDSINNFYKNGKRNISIGLLVTSDEERGGFNGTSFVLRKNKINAKVVIVPDGGEKINHLVVEEKGALNVEIFCKGISSHASRPWEGKNAAETLVEVIKKIKNKFPIESEKKWKTIAVLTNFETESLLDNVVPNIARAKIFFRYTKNNSVEKIMNFVKSLNKAIDIKIVAHGKFLKVGQKDHAIKIYKNIVKTKTGKKCLAIKYHSACDARFFVSKNVPIIIARPTGGNAHGDNEWISIQSLNLFSEILSDFLKKIEEHYKK